MTNKKIVFACDIDDTLIHSYRKRQDCDICVEQLNGKPQGFMSKILYDTLSNLDEGRVTFIPATTRSFTQYSRIHWEQILHVPFAIVANGGRIIGDSKASAIWRDHAAIGEAKNVLEELSGLCDSLGIDYRMVDETYLRLRIDDGHDTKFTERLTRAYSMRVYTFRDDKKRYIVPCHISKGAALSFLLGFVDYDVLIVAGDSYPDISMLNMADIAVVPHRYIRKQITGAKIVCCSDADTKQFSEMIVATIRNWQGTVK